MSNKRSKSKAVEAKVVAQKLLMDFCESTSLHGYSYLYNSNSMCLRVMWIFVIVLMTYLGISFLLSNTNDYLNSRILTSIETSSGSLNVSSLELHAIWSYKELGDFHYSGRSLYFVKLSLVVFLISQKKLKNSVSNFWKKKENFGKKQ